MNVAELLLAGALLAQAPLGGFIRFETFTRLDSVDTLYKVASTLQLRASIEGETYRAFAAVNLIHYGLTGNLQIRPIEAYFTLSQGPLDLTLGKKILSWGTGVFISPSDFITPWDFSVIYSDLEEFRDGPEVLEADLYLGDHELNLALLPAFHPTRYPIPPFSTAIPAGPDTLHMIFDPAGAQIPPRKLQKTELLLRYATVLGPLDLSVLLLRGYDRDPDLAYRYVWIPPRNPSIGSPDSILLTFRYPPVWAAGGNFSLIPGGGYELHGDWLYVRTEDATGDSFAIKNPYLYLALGVNRSFFDDRLSVGLDYLGKRVFAYRPPENFGMEAMLAEFAQSLNFQTGEWIHAAAFRLAWSNLRQTLRLTVQGIYDFTNTDYFVMPSLAWSPADAFTLRIGGLLSSGEGRSPFSQVGKALGQVGFIEGKVSF